MIHQAIGAIVAFVLFCPGALGQCLNQVAANNPNLRTASSNNTWFLVPVSKTTAQAVLDQFYGKAVTGQSNVQLATLPSSDKSLFPNGFPSNQHLILATAGIQDDIRMAAFQIDGPLITGQVIVPFVRRYDSAPGTILQAQANGYLAGSGNNQVAGLVPSTVSTIIEGFPTRLGQFSPDDAAYMNDYGTLENKVAWAVAPNKVSGPGVYIEAVDFQYISGKLKLTTLKLFKNVVNQPALLSGVTGTVIQNLCQRNQYYFNNDTSTMIPRVGNVTFGTAADGLLPQLTGILQQSAPGKDGVYTKIEGFSACAQNVGYNPENCDAAYQNVDKTAL